MSRIGWNKPIELFQRYYSYQINGERDIIIGEVDGRFAGYLTIKWKSGYKPFSDQNIPEINDLNVLPDFRRQGIATQLMDEAERRIALVSPHAGIGFGVTADYGPAQILYIKRGYIPNGRGLANKEQTADYDDIVTVGHDLAFYLTKELGSLL